jgi:N-acetylmuramoyl-L-alanine amidase
MGLSQFLRVISFTFVFFILQFILVANLASAFTIVIDPGHGGIDPGAVGNNLEEADLNLSLSNKIKEKLTPYVDNIVMTRTSDTYYSLEQRAKFVNLNNANLFISIHHDSSTNTLAEGISTHYSSYRAGLDTSDNYVVYNGKRYPFIKEEKIGDITYIFYNDNGSIKKVDINSNVIVYDPTPSDAAKRSGELALNLANSLASLGFDRAYTSTGHKDHNLYVTRWTNMDSVLIENGFISNYYESLKISSPSMQDKMAQKIADTIINYYNLNNVKITSITLDKESPQVNNTPITIKANATGGSTKLYKFNIYGGEEWSVLQDYSTNNTFKWVPSNPGNYKFSVHVKDINSNEKYDDYSAFYYSINEPVTMNVINTSLNSPQVTDTTIKIVANGSGGSEKLYKFWVYDGKTWSALTDYTTSNEYYWKPTTTGNYKFSIHIKDHSSNKEYDDYGVIYYNIVAKAKINNVTLDKNSPQSLSSIINITATGTSGIEPQYKFWLFDGDKWSVLKDYSTSNTYTWKPTSPGEYKFSIHIRDKYSSNQYDDYFAFKYVVVDSPDMTSVSTDISSPSKVNTDINITATAVDGTQKLYKFWVYNGESWNVLQEYLPSNSYTWTPKTSGNYKISVHVKDINSVNEYDDYGAFYHLVN